MNGSLSTCKSEAISVTASGSSRGTCLIIRQIAQSSWDASSARCSGTMNARSASIPTIIAAVIIFVVQDFIWCDIRVNLPRLPTYVKAGISGYRGTGRKIQLIRPVRPELCDCNSRFVHLQQFQLPAGRPFRNKTGQVRKMFPFAGIKGANTSES